MALRSNGTIVAWGSGWGGVTNVPTNLTDVIAISSHQYHNLALRSNGTVVAWGFNYIGTNISGQTDVPAGLTNVVAVAAGEHHSLALKQNGTVVSWGSAAAPPANLSNVKAIAAGNGYSMALFSNHTALVWGNVPSNTPSLQGIAAIAAGHNFAAVLTLSGNVVTWGRSSPTPPAGLKGAIKIAAGYDHAVALLGHPIITSISTNQSGFAGDAFTLNASAISSTPVTYQWQFNGTNLSGATNSSLTFLSAQHSQAGNYTVVISNQYTSVLSEPIGLSIMPVLLNVARSTNTFDLTWPAAATNFVLQESINLSPPLQWTTVETNITREGDFKRISLPPDAARKFFRLIKP